MGTGFQPFLIGNQRSGLQTDLNPWLLPGDAYTVLDNFYLWQGRVQKRLGKSVLASFTAQVYDPDAAEYVYDPDAQEPVVDPTVGTQDPVMGILNYPDTTNSLNLIVMSNKRLFQYTAGALADRTSIDTFTGGTDDFFSSDTWLGKLYLCNGVDALYSWNGTNLTPVVIDPLSGGANSVTGMTFVCVYKSRLVILNTVESSVRYPRRARWCGIGDPTVWSNTAYLDAPTSDKIIGAAFLFNELYVFFSKSIWILRYLGQTNLPFEWVRYSPDKGSVSRMSVLSHNNTLFAAGYARMTGCDGVSAYYIDEKIPNLVANINPQKLGLCYTSLNEAKSQIWMSYPSALSSLSDKVLVLNFDDKSWSTLSIPVHCFGLWPYLYNWSTGQIESGYPQFLGGSSDGYVYLLERGYTDAGTDITATLSTGQLNPFVKQARQVNLGWIDFLVDTSASTMDVSLYANGYSTAYQTTASIPLNDGKGNDKSLIRVPVGCEADFHQLQITHDNAGDFILHAVMAWAKPGARLNG